MFRKHFRIVKLYGRLRSYRIDQRHSMFFGLIRWWDKGAYDLCPYVYRDSVYQAEASIKAQFPNAKIDYPDED